jgi:hypothetical protein
MKRYYLIQNVSFVLVQIERTNQSTVSGIIGVRVQSDYLRIECNVVVLFVYESID